MATDGTQPEGSEVEGGSPFGRRLFLTGASSALAGLLVGSQDLGAAVHDYQVLRPIEPGGNPLSEYVIRDWEHVYRDLYTPDSTYHYMCGPNDTHGCLLRATVKNGVTVYADPSYKYQDCTDYYGNQASARWNPRACVSGLSYVRRTYADRRVKGNYVRKGWKQWADDGFPRGKDGRPAKKYLEGRGKEDFEKISLDEATALMAKAWENIATTYSGEEGAKLLEEQGYDEAMIETIHGAGVETLKFRGGMPYDGPIRIGGMYRMANMMALLDVAVRGVTPEEAKGARHWDSYSWHTDLPPGHPMVSGQQTLDFDLYTAENAELITLWGMNWIATKMPDGHWLTEARLAGAKVTVIAPEYQSSTTKADRSIVIRPGSDGALALGLAQVIISEGLYDAAFVKSNTDLPLLIDTTTSKLLRAADVIPGYVNAPLTNFAKTVTDTEKPPAPAMQNAQIIPEALRQEWGDYVVWDAVTGSPKAVNRNQVGTFFTETGIDPALEGSFEVTLVDGTTTTVRPTFDAVRQYLDDSCTPDQISKVTWAPEDAIVDFAREIADHKTKTLFVTGMGPNHFFNNDCKDRTIIMVAALTNNVGHFGGTVGSYAGNYRLGIFSGIGQYIIEDPFNITFDPAQPAKTKKYYHGESAHYYNYGDRPLREGKNPEDGDKGYLFTGSTHMPAPTKSMYFYNSNSLLGNAKGAHFVFVNVLPKIELVATNEWFWTASCEYSDLVFGVDAWPERKRPDIFGAVSNPFLHAWPVVPDLADGGIDRTYDTKDDAEVLSALAGALSNLTGDQRFSDYWRFITDDQTDVYIQRVFNAGNPTKGYQFTDLHESCKKGTPFYMMMRTSPKIVGWEQTQESKPWYNKTGRLEFYRDEDKFIEYGENLPVHREPVDGTVYEPNVILAKDHPLLNPKGPEDYGIPLDDMSDDVRQVRNVMMSADQIAESKHPLMPKGFTHILITPKYRHACHTMGASTDTDTIIWGPFGDFYRHDKRQPWMAEGYVDLNPDDAKELGVADGDYIWVDANPEDRPFVGWQDNAEDYEVMRWLVRARVNPSIVRQVGRAWFHFYVATHGSVEGQQTREDGLAKNPRTNYQAGYRSGSHQSVTKAWLRPTLQTDDFVRKEAAGQKIGEGFELDVYCTVGAPKESFVKIEKAEDGGIGGSGQWYPAEQGFRPGSESDDMKKFIEGGYVQGGNA
jgi:nitrate reductase alpha subunit